jgi:hypothetical protein
MKKEYQGLLDTRICIVGLDAPEHEQIRSRAFVRMVARETIPKIIVKDGQLLVESKRETGLLRLIKLCFTEYLKTILISSPGWRCGEALACPTQGR